MSGTDLVEHCDLCCNLTFPALCVKYWPLVGLPGPSNLPLDDSLVGSSVPDMSLLYGVDQPLSFNE